MGGRWSECGPRWRLAVAGFLWHPVRHLLLLVARVGMLRNRSTFWREDESYCSHVGPSAVPMGTTSDGLTMSEHCIHEGAAGALMRDVVRQA